MAADIKTALKYPLNFKPLFVLGILFSIAIIASIIPVFVLDLKAIKPADFMPFLYYFLFLLAVMVLLIAILGGYLVHVSRSIMTGNIAKAPPLHGITDLFIDGIKFHVVAVVYIIPPVILMVLAVFIFKIWGLILMLFLIPLFYVFHLAAAHLANTNSLKKALDIPYIYSLIFRNLKGFTLSFIIYLVITFVFLIVSVLIVTYPFVIIAVYVAGQYIFTIFYMECRK